MTDTKAKAWELVRQMTLEEKASLCSGKDFWNFKGIARLGLPSVMVTDGPHGLRKQMAGADQLGINESVPATCFPTASAMACSFDRGLLREVGEAIGEECREENVAVVLGPGMNIKRSPLCGRNFEYYSEDPLLTGELASAFVEGVQSQNVGACCKHFALNNQETRRMTTESVVDERAFREIYLAGFEQAVKKANPWAMMCSYNRLYGEYASDSKLLLDDILRTEWGFDGIVMSDWGAVNDRVAGVLAGLDVEMPAVSYENDKAIVAAVQAGAMEERFVDLCAERAVELIIKSMRRAEAAGTKPGHHAIAKRAARESAVLLKNDDALLPGNLSQKAAVIGAFAKTPRYQGAGSSKINPLRLECAYDELERLGLRFDFAEGYGICQEQPDEQKIEEACGVALGKDIVFVFAGLPDHYESEGYDRTKLTMPDAQVELIRRVSAVNPNIAVILSGGSAIDLSWRHYAKAILLSYLGGQAGAGAISELLLGVANPCGKLAESWPIALEENPSFCYYPGYSRSVEYRESIFVGYRYYDTANKAVYYPFGHGLSYTAFSYDNLHVEGNLTDGFRITAEISNGGCRDGAEIVQLYISPPKSVLFKAEQELKGFAKVYLEAGKRTQVSFILHERDFAFYDVAAHDWRVEDGPYQIRIAASSRDIRLKETVEIEAIHRFATPIADYREKAPCYYDLSKGIHQVPDEAFQAIYGGELPRRDRASGENHTRNSTFSEIRDKWLGRKLVALMRKQMSALAGNDESMLGMLDATMKEAPLRMLLMLGGEQFTPRRLDGLVDMLNGKWLKGVWRFCAK